MRRKRTTEPPIRLDRRLMEELMLGGGRVRRFTQDTPVLPDVWLAHAACLDDRRPVARGEDPEHPRPLPRASGEPGRRVHDPPDLSDGRLQSRRGRPEDREVLQRRGRRRARLRRGVATARGARPLLVVSP